MTGPTENPVFDSVEEMLALSALSQVLGTPIVSVGVTPLESNGFSVNQLSYVRPATIGWC